VTVRTLTEKIVIFVVPITEDDPHDEDEVERRRQNGSVVELLRQQHKMTLVVRLAVFGDALYIATFIQTQISFSYDATKENKILHCIMLQSTSYTHIHPFNGPLSGTTRVSRYQKGKTSLDFTESKDSEWHWYQQGHMQVCTSLHPDNHASTSSLGFLLAGCPSCRPTNSVKAMKAP